MLEFDTIIVYYNLKRILKICYLRKMMRYLERRVSKANWAIRRLSPLN